MTKRISFSKHEQKIIPTFRQKINHAESTEDVKKFFYYSVKELFDDIFQGQVTCDYEDIVLVPGAGPYYSTSQRLLDSESFQSAWRDSDLPRVLGRLADSAVKRYRRLEKHSEKTDLKIRM
mgnify:CR=1 FL=1